MDRVALLAMAVGIRRTTETAMIIKRSSPMVTTNKIDEVRSFYTEVLGFRVVFDGKGYLSLKAGGTDGPEVSFMRPCDEAPVYGGAGIALAWQVDDPDAAYDRLRSRATLVRELQDNPWGDRGFMVLDPAGVGLYIFKDIPMAPEYQQYVKG